MLRWFRADLHIHTCLSPCGDLTMSPKRIVEKAKAEMLDIIGVCDHNSAENVQFAINAAKMQDNVRGVSNPDHNKDNLKDNYCRSRSPRIVANCPCPTLTILPGIEICTKEEVHIVGLFDRIDSVQSLQKIVYQSLPEEKNKPQTFGEQIIANEFDEVEGYNTRLLIGACSLSAKEVVEQIHRLHGISIASHIDREAYSLIGQLGFIPENLEIDAVEISSNIALEDAYEKFPEIRKFPILRNSDAHFLEDIGKATTNLFIEEPSISEITKAFQNKDGRKISYE
ncbi:MAG: PHP-associated domain-containing protein [bacterium]